MASGIDIEWVRGNYARLSDEELINTLTQNATGLSDETHEIIQSEIRKRKLDTNLLKSVESQNKELDYAEIETYCSYLQNLPCPLTGSKLQKLNGTKITTVKSFILFTSSTEKIIIGSPEVLDKANKNATKTSILLGWWGFPWGIVKTFQAIQENKLSAKTNHHSSPNKFLQAFVTMHIGYIEAYKNNPEKLQELIVKAIVI